MPIHNMRGLASALLAAALWASAAQVLADPPRPRAHPAPRRAAAQPQGEQKIDLDLKQADLRNVLRLLADVGGVNLVYGEEVTGQITLRLRRVPWREALAVVLASQGLAMEEQGNIIRVASAEAFADERKAALDERAQCLQSAPLRTRFIPISYARAAALVAQVKATLSPRGTVSADERTNTLVVRDVDCP